MAIRRRSKTKMVETKGTERDMCESNKVPRKTEQAGVGSKMQQKLVSLI